MTPVHLNRPMLATSNKKKLEAIVQQYAEGLLASHGFRRRGTDFVRRLEPGFMHLIEFGLGSSWSSYRGKFTLDLALYIEEAFTILHDSTAPSRPTSMHCDLRKRVSMLGVPPMDKWWDLSEDLRVLESEIQTQLVDLALPFLEPIRGRRAFVEMWEKVGSSGLHLNPRGDVVVGIVLRHLGDENRAKEIILRAVDESVGRPGNSFLSDIARRCGYLGNAESGNANGQV